MHHGAPQSRDLNFAVPPSSIPVCPLTFIHTVNPSFPSRLLRGSVVDLNRGALSYVKRVEHGRSRSRRRKPLYPDSQQRVRYLQHIIPSPHRAEDYPCGTYHQHLFWACTVTVAGCKGKLKSSWLAPPGDCSAQTQAQDSRVKAQGSGYGTAPERRLPTEYCHSHSGTTKTPQHAQPACYLNLHHHINLSPSPTSLHLPASPSAPSTSRLVNLVVL